jgi:hypothetical protein
MEGSTMRYVYTVVFRFSEEDSSVNVTVVANAYTDVRLADDADPDEDDLAQALIAQAKEEILQFFDPWHIPGRWCWEDVEVVFFFEEEKK